jgi:hypothetical protein
LEALLGYFEGLSTKAYAAICTFSSPPRENEVGNRPHSLSIVGVIILRRDGLCGSLNGGNKLA